MNIKNKYRHVFPQIGFMPEVKRRHVKPAFASILPCALVTSHEKDMKDRAEPL